MSNLTNVEKLKAQYNRVRVMRDLAQQDDDTDLAEVYQFAMSAIRQQIEEESGKAYESWRRTTKAVVPAMFALCALLAPSAMAQVTLQPFSPAIECAAPTAPGVRPDDLLCQAWWDGGAPNVAQDKPASVSLYVVEVYLASDGMSDPTKRLLLKKCMDNRVDLQPLKNDIAYVGRVRSVDRSGKQSAWVNLPPFTCNDVRRKRLAAQATAFFDDANDVPAGLDLNPELWETGWNIPCDPTQTATFANDQNHYHHMNAPWIYFDRSMMIARPNVRLWHRWRNNKPESSSFFLDMDVPVGYRHVGYFDGLPQPNDVYPLLEIFSPNASRLSRGVRITMAGEQVDVYEIRGANQVPVKVGSINLRFLNPPHKHTINFRQFWLFTFTRTGQSTGTLTIFVGEDAAGKPIKRLECPLTAFDYDATWLHMNDFTYNTPKEGNRYTSVFHWDNIGIIGPVPVNVFRSYYPSVRGTDQIKNLNAIKTSLTTPVTYSIPVPDQANLDNLVKGTLFLSMDFEGNKASEYRPNPNNRVLVNGVRINCNPPDQDQRSMILTIPAGVLKAQNTVQVYMDRAYVYNPHIRLEVPKAKAVYTSACKIFQNCVPHLIAPAAPGAVLSTVTVGGKTYRGGDTATGQITTFTVPAVASGTITVEGKLEQRGPLISSGVPSPVGRIELLIDGQVANTFTFDPIGVGEGRYKYSVDTKQLPNGPHRFYFRAYGVNGQGSWPSYFEAHGEREQITGMETVVNVAN